MLSFQALSIAGSQRVNARRPSVQELKATAGDKAFRAVANVMAVQEAIMDPDLTEIGIHGFSKNAKAEIRGSVSDMLKAATALAKARDRFRKNGQDQPDLMDAINADINADKASA